MEELTIDGLRSVKMSAGKTSALGMSDIVQQSLKLLYPGLERKSATDSEVVRARNTYLARRPRGTPEPHAEEG